MRVFLWYIKEYQQIYVGNNSFRPRLRPHVWDGINIFIRISNNYAPYRVVSVAIRKNIAETNEFLK